MQQLGHPHREAWHEMGHRFKHHLHLSDKKPDSIYNIPPHATCRVQVVRSVSDWSHGVLKEDSIQNACSSPPPKIPIRNSPPGFLDRELIREAEHFIYIGTPRTRDPSERFLTSPPRKPVLVFPFPTTRAKQGLMTP
jgi:hypothetical protein